LPSESSALFCHKMYKTAFVSRYRAQPPRGELRALRQLAAWLQDWKERDEELKIEELHDKEGQDSLPPSCLHPYVKS